jgi:NAD(P)H-hydrate epimerase
MKLLNASRLREWDHQTLATQHLSLDALVERVGSRCASWLADTYPDPVPFLFICGVGLNGADGLHTALALQRLGRSVKVLLLRYKDSFHPVTVRASLACNNTLDGMVDILEPGCSIADLPPHIVIVDALTGTGLNMPLDGWLRGFAQKINALPNRVVSLDLPSGLPPDCLPGPEDTIIQATTTLSFQTWKRSLLHPESGRYAGNVRIIDIGLDGDFHDATSSKYFTLDLAEARAHYRPRAPFSHKGTHGTAFLIGGSKGLIGALTLAVRAAGRAGAGKVRGLVPECGYNILQMIAPEAMCKTSGQDFIEAIEGWESAKGIGIGPGMGDEQATVDAFGGFLKACKQPLVLDADTLNILGKHPDWLSNVPPRSIMTPHPKEFERMFGASGTTFEAVEKARAMAMQHNVFIALKDKHTAICTPEGACWYNTSGNAGLATGGSGDVLCGIITGLLAQNYDPEAAVLLGVWLHARAGDFAMEQFGQEALIAGDILASIGMAFKELQAPA